MNILDQKCVPCEGGVEAISKVDAKSMRDFHVKDWSIDEIGKHISKKFVFKNFKQALEFVNKVGVIAEDEGHHPDIELGWGKVNIILTTHAIGGLSQNDFIIAAKINHVTRE